MGKEYVVTEVYEPADYRSHPLMSLLDRPVAYHRVFMKITKNPAAAIMLSQAFYWSQRTKDKAGWFYKTAEEWEEETCLSTQNQRTARAKLNEFEWWQEDKRMANGSPTIHYRINLKSLFSHLLELTNPIVDPNNSDLLTLTNGIVDPNKSITESTTEITTDTTTEIKDSSAAAEAPLPTNEHEQSGKSDKMSPLLNGSTKKTSANGTTTSSVQESLDERSEDTLPPSSEAPPSPHEDTPWQKQLKALCWVCFGHQELAMLTREDMGKLTREAKTVFTDKGYTTDELKRWWREDWKPIWKARDGSRPEPSYVRSHIASVRNKQKEFTVGFEKVSGDNWYAEDDDGGDVAKMDCPVWFPPDLWDFADDWQRGEILDARECDRAEWADLIAENREDARQKALSQV